MKIKPEFADFHVTNIPSTANSKSLASVPCSVRRGYLVHFLKRSFQHTSPLVQYSHKHWCWSINVFLQTPQLNLIQDKAGEPLLHFLTIFWTSISPEDFIYVKKKLVYQWSINLTLCALEGKKLMLLLVPWLLSASKN